MSVRRVWQVAIVLLAVTISGCGSALGVVHENRSQPNQNKMPSYSAYTVYPMRGRSLPLSFTVCKSSHFAADPLLQQLPLPKYNSGTIDPGVKPSGPPVNGSVRRGCVIFDHLKTPSMQNPYIAYEGHDVAPVERFQVLPGPPSRAELVFFSDGAGEYPVLTLTNAKTGRSVPVKHAEWLYPAYSMFMIQARTPYILTSIASPMLLRASAIITFDW